MTKYLQIPAVLASLLYTWLYLIGNSWCFTFGLLSPLLFFIINREQKLYADMTLQVYYFAVTIYGWMHWGGSWEKAHWQWSTHLLFILSGLISTVFAARWLQKRTDATRPYLDSFITVFAIIGTWMMMNFVHENWLYFIVVNLLSIYLYFNRRLYWSAAMFLLYLAMSIDGYFELHIFAT